MSACLAALLDALALEPGQRALVTGPDAGDASVLAAAVVGRDGDVEAIAEPDVAFRARSSSFDRILVTGASGQVPAEWLPHLVDGGRLALVLEGSLTAVGLCVTKVAGSEARGRFLPFMAGSEPGLRSEAPVVETLLEAPIDVLRRWSEREAELWPMLHEPGSDLRLWLQWDVPGLRWHDWARDGASCGCLHHLPHQTLILLDPSQRILELRGDEAVWSAILSSYRRWIGAGQPGRAAYELVVRRPGGPFVVCGTSSPAREWRIP